MERYLVGLKLANTFEDCKVLFVKLKLKGIAFQW